MRTIDYHQIKEAVRDISMDISFNLPEDVLASLHEAREAEAGERAGDILTQLLANAEAARQDQVPLCQDTGLTVVFIEQGSEVFVEAEGKTLFDAVNEGVEAGYEKAFLRKSIVAEPVNERKNTGTNTPAIIHWFPAAGDKMRISVMAKGGGCENKSQFRMFKPTAERSEIIDWIAGVAIEAGADACPPLIAGVGIGGNFERSCQLAKMSLLRKLNSFNPEPYYADMEKEILKKINASGIGPQGMGGVTTALGCMIETAPCHIASLPVAVNIECHSHRHGSVIL